MCDIKPPTQKSIHPPRMFPSLTKGGLRSKVKGGLGEGGLRSKVEGGLGEGGLRSKVERGLGEGGLRSKVEDHSKDYTSPKKSSEKGLRP